MSYCPFDIVSSATALSLKERFIETRYGKIALRHTDLTGSPQATLFIHGIGTDWTTWTPILAAQQKARLSTVDQVYLNMPGFGDSENLLGTLDIAHVGGTILEIIESMGYERVRIVGHSMGGFLTLDMAGRYPETIESIHLIAGPYFSILESIQHPILSFRHDSTVAAAFGAQYLLARTGQLEEIALLALYRVGLFRLFLFPFASHPFALKESVVQALCYQVYPDGLLRTAANGPGYDADRIWGRATCPIWAVFGDKDKLVPQKDMIRLLACQPSARCETIRDVGHLMHIERPFRVLDALGLNV